MEQNAGRLDYELTYDEFREGWMSAMLRTRAALRGRGASVAQLVLSILSVVLFGGLFALSAFVVDPANPSSAVSFAKQYGGVAPWLMISLVLFGYAFAARRGGRAAFASMAVTFCVVAGVAWFMLKFAPRNYDESEIGLAAPWIFLAVYWFTLTRQLIRSRSAALLWKRYVHLHGPRSLEFTATGYRLVSPMLREEVDWPLVSGVDETAATVCIRLKSLGMEIIPKRTFVDAIERENFVKLVKDATAAGPRGFDVRQQVAPV